MMGGINIFFTILIGLLIGLLFLCRGRKKIVVLFLNDYEWRGGGGFITMSIELVCFYGIPYHLNIHNFTKINSYSERSFSAFKEHLAPTLFFRDANYSLFPEDNFRRLSHFYEKSLASPPPSVWVQIPFSFIESLTQKDSQITVSGRSLGRKAIFRSFTDLVGDNNLPPERRKEILKKTIPKFLITILHPYFLLRCVILSIRALITQTIVIRTHKLDRKKPDCFIGLCENNLKGRKTNRFLSGENHYVFHIIKKNGENLIGQGYVQINRSSFADDQFPYSGNYRCSFHIEASRHFQILGGTGLLHEIQGYESLCHSIPFTFEIQASHLIRIISQLNMPIGYHSRVSVYTDAFHTLPQTLLSIQHDHWHHQIYKSGQKIEFSLDMIPDRTPIRMAYRYILDPHTIEIRFQKPTNATKKNFQIASATNIWQIKDLRQSVDQQSIFITTDNPLPFYKNKKSRDVLSLKIQGIVDIQGDEHYREPRVVWLPWIHTL